MKLRHGEVGILHLELPGRRRRGRRGRDVPVAGFQQVFLEKVLAQLDGQEEGLAALGAHVLLRPVPVVPQLVYPQGTGRVEKALAELARVDPGPGVHSVDVVLQVALGRQEYATEHALELLATSRSRVRVDRRRGKVAVVISECRCCCCCCWRSSPRTTRNLRGSGGSSQAGRVVAGVAAAVAVVVAVGAVAVVAEVVVAVGDVDGC